MSALEACLNSMAEELLIEPYGDSYTVYERALLLEKEVRFERGEYYLSNSLKISRITDRIEFLYYKFTGAKAQRKRPLVHGSETEHRPAEQAGTSQRTCAAHRQAGGGCGFVRRKHYKRVVPGRIQTGIPRCRQGSRVKVCHRFLNGVQKKRMPPPHERAGTAFLQLFHSKEELAVGGEGPAVLCGYRFHVVAGGAERAHDGGARGRAGRRTSHTASGSARRGRARFPADPPGNSPRPRAGRGCAPCRARTERSSPGIAAIMVRAWPESRLAKPLTAGSISRRAMARAVLPSMVTSLQYSSCLISCLERSSA